jgi:tetratricopeptide (TPR) repeat protein
MDETLEVLDAVRARFPDASTAELGAVDAVRGEVLGVLGRYEEARQLLNAAVSALKESAPEQCAEAQATLARNLASLGHLPEALAAAEDAVATLEARGDLARLATALRVLGGIQQELAPTEVGAATLRRAGDVARRVGNAEEQAAALLNLGYCLVDSDPAEAERCLTEALALFTAVGIRKGVAAANANLAGLYGDLGRMAEARAAAEAALAVAEEIGSLYWITGSLLGIAQAELWFEHWEAAHRSAERCLALCREAGWSADEHRSRHARRYLYAAEHRLRQAPSLEEFEAIDS